MRDHCIHLGQAWETSYARDVCSEGEYYNMLIKTFKAGYRVSSTSGPCWPIHSFLPPPL